MVLAVVKLWIWIVFLQESRDNIKNLSETEDNYEFIFNNLTHVIDPSK